MISCRAIEVLTSATTSRVPGAPAIGLPRRVRERHRAQCLLGDYRVHYCTTYFRSQRFTESKQPTTNPGQGPFRRAPRRRPRRGCHVVPPARGARRPHDGDFARVTLVREGGSPAAYRTLPSRWRTMAHGGRSRHAYRSGAPAGFVAEQRFGAGDADRRRTAPGVSAGPDARGRAAVLPRAAPPWEPGPAMALTQRARMIANHIAGCAASPNEANRELPHRGRSRELVSRPQ